MTIKLGGQDVSLQFDLTAAKAVNAHFGSFTAAFRRIIEFDFVAYCAVVAAGTDQDIKDIEADVYEAGMPDLAKPLADYLSALANGGRPPAEA
jgi:hypothetical protein